MFDNTPKDYESAHEYCVQLFHSLPKGNLVSIHDCDEYKLIKNMLIKVARENDNLKWTGDSIEIWTAGYEAPQLTFGVNTSTSSSDGFSSQRLWLTTDSDLRSFEESCMNEKPGKLCGVSSS